VTSAPMSAPLLDAVLKIHETEITTIIKALKLPPRMVQPPGEYKRVATYGLSPNFWQRILDDTESTKEYVLLPKPNHFLLGP